MNHVVVDRAGRVFAVDTTNRMFVLDRSGTLLHTFAGTAPGAGDIEFGPFVIDDEGRMYLTDISGTTEARLIIGQLNATLATANGSLVERSLAADGDLLAADRAS
jgi:hypothetical protein